MNAPQLVPLTRLISRPHIPNPEISVEAAGRLVDRRGRPLRELRLSVTDRCNFRCTYCMPRARVGVARPAAPKSRLLDFDELTRVAEAFIDLGVKKVRVTGGEPLVRRDLHKLIERLARLSPDELCLTTNGSLLAAKAKLLADAGLHRVTVSLDALDQRTFWRVSDSYTPVSRILSGIDEARRVGLEPVKINMVVLRGVNDHAILPMAEWARREHVELRFIEYMDVGCSNGWRPEDVVTAGEILSSVQRQWPIEPVESRQDPKSRPTAERFRYQDGNGFIGIVASITRPFCGDCTRARVSSHGELFSCLFAPFGFDLATLLRQGSEIRSSIASVWAYRDDHYSEIRTQNRGLAPRPEMSLVGG